MADLSTAYLQIKGILAARKRIAEKLGSQWSELAEQLQIILNQIATGEEETLRPLVDRFMQNGMQSPAKDIFREIGRLSRSARPVDRTRSFRLEELSIDVSSKDSVGADDLRRAATELAHELAELGISARYINICIVTHENQTVVPKTANLEANRQYDLRLDIGLLSSDSVVENAVSHPFPTELLPETEEGHWLEVVVVSDDFTISRRRYNLFLPNSGASWVCNCPPGGDHTCSKDSRNPYLFIPLTAPERAGIAHLRIAIYYEKNLIQSQFLTAQINGAEQKAGGYSSRIDYTLTADLRNVSFLPPRTLHILTNQNLDGTHRLIINDKSDEPLAFNLRDDQIGGAINGARQALRDIHMREFPIVFPNPAPPEPENLLDEKNAKSKKKFIEDLKSLATLGWDLCAMLSDQQDWQAKLQEPATIQVSRTVGSTFVFPWALVYDIPLFTYEQAKLCPLVQKWDEVNTLIATSTRRCPYENQHAQRNTLCPFGFWGIKHVIEQPPSMPEGRALPLQIQAAHDPAELVVGLSLKLNQRQTTDHLHALEMAHFKVLRYNSLKQIPDALKPSVEIVYFYCHGGRAKVPGTGQATPYLEVGVGGKKEQFQPSDVTAWRMAVWPPDHWRDTSPLVFLNGCHTTELTPELLVNFVDGFNRAYAAGVIGTEITILQPLASEAAVQFFSHFQRNKMNVGQALQQMRVHFLMKGNLLGLAYTPYCSADLHF
jgi:hypothetical protein